MSLAVPERHRTVPRRDPHVTVALVRREAELPSWPLLRSGLPDLAVVDELARLQLGARRLGCSIQLRGACVHLVELLELVGLSELVTGTALRQVDGEAERLEQTGIDEVVVPDDPVV